MTCRGHVQNGVVVLDEAVVLPEGATVEVALAGTPHATDEAGPSLYERLKSVVGKAQGLPPDAASNVHHYLYGQPKQ